METQFTNFDGSLDDICPYCGESQRQHVQDVGQADGVQYLHRIPCAPERREITKTEMKKAAIARLIVSAYEVGKYVWSKIPFKKELALIFRLLRRAYVSVHGLIYYLVKYRNKP